MTNLQTKAALFRTAAAIIDGWEAGEFWPHTAEELWGLGFDAPAGTMGWCSDDGSTVAAHNAECNRIEFADDSGEMWTIDLDSGELAQA
tara:strand:+ start:236 stop:502 length:267 start_codon:yes stop_codon:yes gene_type:complete